MRAPGDGRPHRLSLRRSAFEHDRSPSGTAPPARLGRAVDSRVPLSRRRGLLGTDRPRAQDRPPRRAQRGRHLGGRHPRGRGEVDRRRGPRRDDALHRLGVHVEALARAQVPHPRNASAARVPGSSDPLHGQRRVHELLDGSHPLEVRGDRRDQGQHARAAGERQDVPHDARARRRREPRAAARRRGDRPDVRRHEGGADADPEERRAGRRPRHRRRRGLHDDQGHGVRVDRP